MNEKSPLLNSNNEFATNNEYVSPGILMMSRVVKGGTVLIVALIVGVILLRSSTPLSTELSTVQGGLTLFAMSAQHHKYVRFDGELLHLTERIPWAHGSAMQIFDDASSESSRCFHIRSMSGGWLYSEKDYIFLKFGPEYQAGASKFEISDSAHIISSKPIYARIKLCNEEKYWKVTENEAGDLSISLSTLKPAASHSIRSDFAHENKSGAQNNIHQPHSDLTLSLFRIEAVTPMHGVNLGGWFIPEIWMNPSFSNYTGLGWAASLCNVVLWNRTLAEVAIQKHLSTWITAADFEEIAADGFNSVRVPLGYWNLIPDPYALFVPSNTDSSLQYIDFAFDMCEKFNLSLLLDLHGAPGSQNGVDHSGCSLGSNWLEQPDNLNLTLTAIEVMMMRYGSRRALVGVELVNEPAEKYCTDNPEELLKFYQDAYILVRRYSPSVAVVFNELYEGCYALWRNKLREPEYYNVLIDLHLYNWQLPYTAQSAETHIANAAAWVDTVDHVGQAHPVLIGEWCFSTGTVVQAGQAFVSACTQSFQRAAGWFVWNWKVERGIHFDEWNVQLQYELPNGLRV